MIMDKKGQRKEEESKLSKLFKKEKDWNSAFSIHTMNQVLVNVHLMKSSYLRLKLLEVRIKPHHFLQFHFILRHIFLPS